MELLNLINTEDVVETQLTKKVTLGGKTEVYKVYKVKLDKLFYNDQNGRISTWISQYKSENHIDNFDALSREEYNDIIGGFIRKSNSDALDKTKNNIRAVGQRVAGVVLNDGRIIDGNRRFTCLRELSKDFEEAQYFETVILDNRYQASAEEIKMLELYIQHGEEDKLGYSLIDYAISTYQDIEVDRTLNITQYCDCTGDTKSEINQRISIAKIIIEFLDYIGLPYQYRVAEDYTVYSVFGEMLQILNRLKTEEEKTQIKHILFNHIMMDAVVDRRHFIRMLNNMEKENAIASLVNKEMEISERIQDLKSRVSINTLDDVKKFVANNKEISEELTALFEYEENNYKLNATKAVPSKSVAKSITALKDIDTRVFDALSVDEKKGIQEQIEKLSKQAQIITNKLNLENYKGGSVGIATEENKTFTPATRNVKDPIVICNEEGTARVENAHCTLTFTAIKTNPSQRDGLNAQLFIVDENNKILGSIYNKEVKVDETIACDFDLDAEVSNFGKVYLIIKSINDAPTEVLSKIAIKVA